MNGRKRFRDLVPLTLAQANEKYKGVARIEYDVYWHVYDGHDTRWATFDNLEDAVEECAYLDKRRKEKTNE